MFTTKYTKGYKAPAKRKGKVKAYADGGSVDDEANERQNQSDIDDNAVRSGRPSRGLPVTVRQNGKFSASESVALSRRNFNDAARAKKGD